MSADVRIAMWVWLWRVTAVPAKELALNCKVVLGHILSGIESKDRPSGLESENGAQARDHIGLLAVGLIRFAVG